MFCSWILFLDIQLNDGNSFLFIEQANPQSMIVFTTAYDEYAVQDFTVNSVDYLLKPIHKDRLVNAIRKCERLLSLHENSLSKLLDLEQLLRTIAEKKEKQFRTRFLISVPKHFYTIQVTEIAYFYSEDKVTFAVTRDGKSHIIDFPLNKLEEQLDGKQFHRVNRQFILSVDSILDIQPYFNGKAIIKVRPSYDGVIQIMAGRTVYIARLKQTHVSSKTNARFASNERTNDVKRPFVFRTRNAKKSYVPV